MRSSSIQSVLAIRQGKGHTLEDRKLEGLRFVMQKVVRILSGQDIKVIVESNGSIPAPGWTDGRNISLNSSWLLPKLRGDVTYGAGFLNVVAAIKGLVYHELSHIFYSPTDNTLINRRVRDEGLWWAYNALEDQRIESLFTNVYEPAGVYFTRTVAEWISTTPEALKTSFMLLYGRRYLPVDLRLNAERAFTNAHANSFLLNGRPITADYVKGIINEYLTLPGFTKNPDGETTNRIMELIRAYAGIVQDLNPPRTSPTMDNSPNASGNAVNTLPPSKNEPEQPNNGPGVIPEDTDPAESDEPGDLPGDDAGDDAGDDDASPTSGAGGSGSDSSEPGNALNDLADIAADLVDDVLNTTELQKDLKGIADSVRSNVQDSDGMGGMMAQSVRDEPLTVSRAVTKRCTRALASLRLELEAEKEYRSHTGRLNMRRVMSAAPHETDLFDQWQDDISDEGGIELVVLLDLSGSMAGILPLVSQEMWVIKRACDDLDIRCTVLGYSYGWVGLYRPSERADKQWVRQFAPIGGTHALEALRRAHTVLTNSDRPNRALVTITDGIWEDDEDDVSAVMGSLHANNTTSMLLSINTGYGVPENTHDHQIVVAGDSIQMMPNHITKMTERILRKTIASNRI
jgi:hypothetical protein